MYQQKQVIPGCITGGSKQRSEASTAGRPAANRGSASASDAPAERLQPKRQGRCRWQKGKKRSKDALGKHAEGPKRLAAPLPEYTWNLEPETGQAIAHAGNSE